MRDLYKKLDIPPYSSYGAIRDAYDKCTDEGLREDCNAALLENEEHKRYYDSVHRTLVSIGVLRSKLGIANTNKWSMGEIYDFYKMPQNVSKLAEFKAKTRIVEAAFVGPRPAGCAYSLGYSYERYKNFIIGILIVLGTIYGLKKAYEDAEKPQTPSTSTSPSSNSYPEQPLPESGAGYVAKTFDQNEFIVPLTIRNNSGDSHCVVMFQDSLIPSKFIIIFMRSGENVTMKVPDGSYILKYAMGNRWFGYFHMFGDQSTRYYASEQLLKIRKRSKSSTKAIEIGPFSTETNLTLLKINEISKAKFEENLIVPGK